MACFSVEKGGGFEEGGLEIHLERRDPDDGKRLEAVDVVLGLFLGEICWNWEGVQGEGGKKSDRSGGIRIFLGLEKGSFACMPAHFGSFMREIMISSFAKNGVLPAWELIFRKFLFSSKYFTLWEHPGNSSFTCMGAQFWRTRSTLLRFFTIFGEAKKTCFRMLLVFTFFRHF